jgi:hypothetical protein
VKFDLLMLSATGDRQSSKKYRRSSTQPTREAIALPLLPKGDRILTVSLPRRVGKKKYLFQLD